MPGAKTALGIDLSAEWINLALLKKTKSGIRLLGTACAPVPAGVIKEGNIEDPVLLAKTVRELKCKNKMHSGHSAISLVANPVLLQILDLPKIVPSNIGQFVRDEVKNYAILPRENIVLDFCGVKSSPKLKTKRALVAAVENQRIIESAKALNAEGVSIEAVEPAALAYIRACYEKKIASEIGKNILFAVVHNNIFTLCLFRNQNLDFLRTKKIESEILESEKYSEWLAEEIYTILQFYELEVLEKRDDWQITLITPDTVCSVEELRRTVANNVEGVELEVRSQEDAYLDTAVAAQEFSCKPSVIAIGLAMKLLDTPCCGLNINLLPSVVDEIKAVKKQRLTIVKIAAVVFACMLLYIGFLSIEGRQMSQQMEKKKQDKHVQDTQSLVTKQIQLGGQIKKLSEEIRNIDTVLKAGLAVDWGHILDDIMHKIPKKVQIASLTSNGSSRLSLEGYALSYEAIRTFVSMLDESRFIKSASLTSTEQGDKATGLVEYSISCTLIQ